MEEGEREKGHGRLSLHWPTNTTDQTQLYVRF